MKIVVSFPVSFSFLDSKTEIIQSTFTDHFELWKETVYPWNRLNVNRIDAISFYNFLFCLLWLLQICKVEPLNIIFLLDENFLLHVALLLLFHFASTFTYMRETSQQKRGEEKDWQFAGFILFWTTWSWKNKDVINNQRESRRNKRKAENILSHSFQHLLLFFQK